MVQRLFSPVHMSAFLSKHLKAKLGVLLFLFQESKYFSPSHLQKVCISAHLRGEEQRDHGKIARSLLKTFISWGSGFILPVLHFWYQIAMNETCWGVTILSSLCPSALVHLLPFRETWDSFCCMNTSMFLITKNNLIAFLRTTPHLVAITRITGDMRSALYLHGALF